MESYFKSFDGTEIWYKYHKGERDCIVFIHGLTGSSSAWNEAFTFFSKLGYSILLMDLRGHGSSQKPVSNYRIEDAVKDISLLLDSKKIKKAIIVGHSFGGMVCQKFYELHPNKVIKIILISTNYSTIRYKRVFLKSLITTILIVLGIPLFKLLRLEKEGGKVDYSKFRGSSDMDLKRIFIDLRITNLVPFLRFFIETIKHDSHNALDRLDVPILIIHGEKDSILPKRAADDLHSIYRKSSKLILIENEGHIPIINSPEKINRIINEFLKKKKL
ncbi:MAG: alpha/beta hydrolase [archaeon]